MIESIYVKEGREATVNGYIPLYNQAQNIQYEPKRRNSQDTAQLSLPFEFKIKLPSPRIARQIIERDKLGRIQVTATPEASY